MEYDCKYRVALWLRIGIYSGFITSDIIVSGDQHLLVDPVGVRQKERLIEEGVPV
jgi:hypothetical protein